MKIKKAKFVVGSMLTACSLAIVGSITSTFAWYTYSTKTTLAYSGLSGGKTGNLQMRLAGGTEAESGEWKDSLSIEEIKNESIRRGYAGNSLSPITIGEGIARSGIDCTIKNNGNYKFNGPTTALQPKFPSDNIKDANGKYVFLQVQIQFRNINPNDPNEKFNSQIFVSFLDARLNDDDGRDITKGLRIHFAGSTENNYLVAPGYTDDGVTTVNGPYNFANSEEDFGVYCIVDGTRYAGTDYETGWYDFLYTESGANDKAAELNQKMLDEGIEGVTFEGKEHYDVGIPNGDGTYRKYIDGWDKKSDLVQVQYGTSGAVEQYKGKDSFVSTFNPDGTIKTAKSIIGTTDASNLLTLTLTIYLEGWDPAVVDSNYGAGFDIGMQFECERIDKRA